MGIVCESNKKRPAEEPARTLKQILGMEEEVVEATENSVDSAVDAVLDAVPAN